MALWTRIKQNETGEWRGFDLISGIGLKILVWGSGGFSFPQEQGGFRVRLSPGGSLAGGLCSQKSLVALEQPSCGGKRQRYQLRGTTGAFFVSEVPP